MGKALAAIACGMGVLAAAPAARADGDCSSAYPNGLGAGTWKVYVGLNVVAQDKMSYKSPASLSEQLRDEFEQTVQQDAAGNPSGPQFTFDVALGSQDVWLGVTLTSSGTDPDVSDQAWVQLAARSQTGSLFDYTGAAFTSYAAGGPPEGPAVADAAHRFYRYMADGWTCPGASSGAQVTSTAATVSGGTSGATATYGATDGATDGTVASDLAQKQPFQHLRVTAGLDGGLSTAPGLGSSAVATLEAIGVGKNGMGIGVTLRGGPVLAGGWITGATGWFGPIGSSGKNTFGLQGGISYDGISGGVLTAFAIHGRALYGRRLGPTSALEVSLDGAWGASNSGTAPYPNGASTLPSTDELALAATWARGFYSIGVDYRELLGGRFLGVALGFGIGMP